MFVSQLLAEGRTDPLTAHCPALTWRICKQVLLAGNPFAGSHASGNDAADDVLGQFIRRPPEQVEKDLLVVFTHQRRARQR